MKKILLINPGPFGSLTDTYFYCLHLKDKYEITYLGFDEGKEISNFQEINLVHLHGSGNTIKQKILFIKKARQLIKFGNFNFILVNYFFTSSFINFLARRNLIIDIRSSYIASEIFKSKVYNLILGFEVRLFKNITIISDGLLKFLNLPNRAHILPLGAPSFPLLKKDFTILKILYVGTFHERNIVNTIYGFANFILSHNDNKIAEYIIIGFGSDDEIIKIKDAIIITGMENNIFFRGTVRYPELNSYLKDCNVGMSYIPIKEHFENQPPTKTFEYLLSGMAVIATGTKENKKIISNKNGFIIGDSINDITDGLEYIYINRYAYNSEEIQIQSQKYSWENIIKQNLIPYIESF